MAACMVACMASCMGGCIAAPSSCLGGVSSPACLAGPACVYRFVFFCNCVCMFVCFLKNLRG